jgi:hypothetical protein
MTCKDVKDTVEEYGTVAELVKTICTDRVCTLDAIQKSLETKGVKVSEGALIAIMSQIKEMMTFCKLPIYGIGDAVIYQHYWWGIVNMGEAIGNTIVQIEYKNFYLYNKNGFEDDAFREHVFSKLEFEELRRVEVSDSWKLGKALEDLNIVRDKWTNYVNIGYKGGVYCKKWHDRGEYSTTEKLGKLISRTSSK